MPSDLFSPELSSQKAGSSERVGAFAPLPERMRPRALNEVQGQEQLLGEHGVLRRSLSRKSLPSMILVGPPGTGKTTLARLLAEEIGAHFAKISAVTSGIADLRKLVDAARERAARSVATVLFVDEIHRWNKAQQDSLLPHVEDGTVVLIGATTENPSFSINHALLSRARVLKLQAHSENDLRAILRNALSDRERGLGRYEVSLSEEAETLLLKAAEGDARKVLSLLDLIVLDAPVGEMIDLEHVRQSLPDVVLRYDRKGDEHYDVISAFIKSMRGNDPSAAVYWMMRMLEAGEDPDFVARRMIIFASEDVGNADPQALTLATSAHHALRAIGLPEATMALAQAATYLASTVKSNASYMSWKAAQEDVREKGALAVPMHLRNAPTKLMKEWGHGEGYRYPHDEGGHAKGVEYLPDALRTKRYYQPKDAGFEIKLKARLERLWSTDSSPQARGEESKPEE